MTERIYYSDPYCRDFKATVVSNEKNGEFYEIILDKTAFFPEGGGQAADMGFIDGVQVTDVFERGDDVVHKTKEPVSNRDVSCEIDWELRFSRMQGHSAEHIVSGLVHSMFGYTNIGFHMGDTVMTVDFDGILTPGDVEKIELEANRAVYKNVPVTAYFPSLEDAKALEYRSKLDIKEGLRIVEIEGVDCCACCAPHVSRTGEIGIIKITDFANHRGGTRIEILAGVHALCDYIALNRSNKALMKLFSAKRYEVFEGASKQNDALSDLRNANQSLSKRLAVAELETNMVGNCLYSISIGFGFDELRHCANSLGEGFELCILLSRAEDGTFFYVVSGKEDVGDTVKALNSSLNGKGGGRGNYAQGKIGAFGYAEVEKAVKDILTLK